MKSCGTMDHFQARQHKLEQTAQPGPGNLELCSDR